MTIHIQDNNLPHHYDRTGEYISGLPVVCHNTKRERKFLFLNQALITGEIGEYPPTFSLLQLAALNENDEETQEVAIFIHEQKSVYDFSGFVVGSQLQSEFNTFMNRHNITRLTDDNTDPILQTAPLLHELGQVLFANPIWSGDAHACEIRRNNLEHPQPQQERILHRASPEENKEEAVIWTLEGPTTRFMPSSFLWENSWMNPVLNNPNFILPQYQANVQSLIHAATQSMPPNLIACFDPRSVWHAEPILEEGQTRTAMVLSGYEEELSSSDDSIASISYNDSQLASDTQSSNTTTCVQH